MLLLVLHSTDLRECHQLGQSKSVDYYAVVVLTKSSLLRGDGAEVQVPLLGLLMLLRERYEEHLDVFV